MKRSEMEEFLRQQGSGPETTARILGRMEDGGMEWEPEESTAWETWFRTASPATANSPRCAFEAGLEIGAALTESQPTAEEVAGSGGIPDTSPPTFKTVIDEAFRRLRQEDGIALTPRADAAFRRLAAWCYAEGQKAIAEPRKTTSDIILNGCTDAEVWAAAFADIWGGCLVPDEATMISWFANAIESGREAGGRQDSGGHEFRLSCVEFKISRLTTILESRGLA